MEIINNLKRTSSTKRKEPPISTELIPRTLKKRKLNPIMNKPLVQPTLYTEKENEYLKRKHLKVPAFTIIDQTLLLPSTLKRVQKYLTENMFMEEALSFNLSLDIIEDIELRTHIVKEMAGLSMIRNDQIVPIIDQQTNEQFPVYVAGAVDINQSNNDEIIIDQNNQNNINWLNNVQDAIIDRAQLEIDKESSIPDGTIILNNNHIPIDNQVIEVPVDVILPDNPQPNEILEYNSNTEIPLEIGLENISNPIPLDQNANQNAIVDLINTNVYTIKESSIQNNKNNQNKNQNIEKTNNNQNNNQTLPGNIIKRPIIYKQKPLIIDNQQSICDIIKKTTYNQPKTLIGVNGKKYKLFRPKEILINNDVFITSKEELNLTSEQIRYRFNLYGIRCSKKMAIKLRKSTLLLNLSLFKIASLSYFMQKHAYNKNLKTNKYEKSHPTFTKKVFLIISFIFLENLTNQKKCAKKLFQNLGHFQRNKKIIKVIEEKRISLKLPHNNKSDIHIEKIFSGWNRVKS